MTISKYSIARCSICRERRTTGRSAGQYEGYIKRQGEQVEKFKKLEQKRIPEYFNYDEVKGFPGNFKHV
jgi:tRNA U34 5-carboxymethylaminomethyl modifying enzyme MnmG/GidA